MATAMGREIDDACSTTSPVKGGLDPSARGRVAVVIRPGTRIGRSTWSTEDGTGPVLQAVQLQDDTRMQRHASRFPVLGLRKGNVASIEIDIVPVEPQSLASPRTGVQQKHNQGVQVIA